MIHLKTFEEFINEATDTDGFVATQAPDVIGQTVKTISELTPGQEYQIEDNSDMIYQGNTGGVYIFNGEDKANDLQFSEAELEVLITDGKVKCVIE